MVCTKLPQTSCWLAEALLIVKVAVEPRDSRLRIILHCRQVEEVGTVLGPKKYHQMNANCKNKRCTRFEENDQRTMIKLIFLRSINDF